MAAVFAPRRRSRDGAWVESESAVLMEATQIDEGAAFAWLSELEQNGRILRESLRSIDGFEPSADSADAGNRIAGSASVLTEESQDSVRGGAGPSPAGVRPGGQAAASPAAQDVGALRYRRAFSAARSGNGWTRRLELPDGWTVTLWVGINSGSPSAAVFSPRKQEANRWVEAHSGALMEATHADFDSAFAWLQELEEAGTVREDALLSVAEFQR